MRSPTPGPTLPLERTSRYAVLFLLLSMPLPFGATHPIVQGLYTFFLLVGAGGWWLLVASNLRFACSCRRGSSSSTRRVPAPESFPESSPETAVTAGRKRAFLLPALVVLLLYIFFTTIPLPLGVLEWLSPVRALNLEAVNRLAGADISFAPLSYSGPLTLKEGFFYLALLLYFFSLRKLLDRSPKFVLQVVAVMVAITFGEALYGLAQVMNSQLGVLWLPSSLGAGGVARGTIIYRNQYASLLNMVWPLALAMAALNLKKYYPPAPFLFAAGMIILAVFFSLSRGGVLAFFGVAGMMAATTPFSRRQKIGALALMLVFLAFYGALLGGYGELLHRFTQFKTGALGRLAVWKMSLPMIFDHPLTGIGLNSYVKLSPLYLKHAAENTIWDRAHNEFLEFTIELGIPAMLLFCGCLGLGLWRCARRLKERKEALFDYAALAGSGGFFIHGLTDFGWHLPVNCVYCVTLLALLAASLNRQPGKKIEA